MVKRQKKSMVGTTLCCKTFRGVKKEMKNKKNSPNELSHNENPNWIL